MTGKLFTTTTSIYIYNTPLSLFVYSKHAGSLRNVINIGTCQQLSSWIRPMKTPFCLPATHILQAEISGPNIHVYDSGRGMAIIW